MAFQLFCAVIIGSFLYENGTIAGPTATQNDFLSDVSKGKVNGLQIINREFGEYTPQGSTQKKSFAIGSVDQLEDSVRRVCRQIVFCRYN